MLKLFKNMIMIRTPLQKKVNGLLRVQDAKSVATEKETQLLQCTNALLVPILQLEIVRWSNCRKQRIQNSRYQVQLLLMQIYSKSNASNSIWIYRKSLVSNIRKSLIAEPVASYSDSVIKNRRWTRRRKCSQLSVGKVMAILLEEHNSASIYLSKREWWEINKIGNVKIVKRKPFRLINTSVSE
jgi:hypothetical protein